MMFWNWFYCVIDVAAVVGALWIYFQYRAVSLESEKLSRDLKQALVPGDEFARRHREVTEENEKLVKLVCRLRELNGKISAAISLSGVDLPGGDKPGGDWP